MNNLDRVVITGVGLVTPLGVGIKEFWENAFSGKSFIKKITRFDNFKFPYQYGGEIKNFIAKDHFPKKLYEKIDRFTQYAIVAADHALLDSKLCIEQADKNRFGVYVGNMFGGWEFTDQELRKLYIEGAIAVSPYLATAWFPAAPQGEISIRYGLKGHSKTISTGKISGLASIAYAAEAISMGRIDYALAGGTEAMLTPFMLTACASLNDTDNCWKLSTDGCYEPFSKVETGYVPGEGAAFIVLESLTKAINRGANIYGEIRGFGHAHEACAPHLLTCDGMGLRNAIEISLNDADIPATSIDLILADGAGCTQADNLEAEAIKKIFTSHQSIYTTASKSIFGDMLGAAGAMDVAIAALSIRHQKILPTINKKGIDPIYGLNVVTNPMYDIKINNILINGRSHGGTGMAMIISNIN